MGPTGSGRSIATGAPLLEPLVLIDDGRRSGYVVGAGCVCSLAPTMGIAECLDCFRNQSERY